MTSLQINPPTNVVAKRLGTSVELTWTACREEAVSGYKANISPDGGKTWQSGPLVEGRTTTRMLIGNLDPAKDSLWRFGVRSIGGSSRSPAVAITPATGSNIIGDATIPFTI